MSIRTDLVALILIALVAGCSAPQPGTPAGEPSPASPPPTPAAPPATVVPPAGLATIEACDLLTAQEAGSLGMRPQGRAETVLGLRRCDWSIPGGGGVSTGINERRGIDKLNFTDASSVTDIRIGRHRAKRAVDARGRGYCEIDFAVGDNANVSVLALYPNDTARACAATDQAAALIEPKLP